VTGESNPNTARFASTRSLGRCSLAGMAITATLTSATAYALKYHVQYDGVGGAGSGTIKVSRDTLLDDCAVGPLADLLAATSDPAEWALLPLGAALSLYPATNRTDAAGSFGARFDNTLGPPAVSNLSVYCTDGVTLEGIVEIRFNHTIDR